MSITWQEREHEEKDMVALNNLSTIEALKNCGLLKYFKLSKMRQQIELLQFLCSCMESDRSDFSH